MFHKTIQSELQEMGNNEADDALLLALLGKNRFPLNRLKIEMMVPSYSLDYFLFLDELRKCLRSCPR